MIGLTSLITRNPPLPPKFSRGRALFVLNKMDEILAWERRKEIERDTKFVPLGHYLCEVRAMRGTGRAVLEGGGSEVL